MRWKGYLSCCFNVTCACAAFGLQMTIGGSKEVMLERSANRYGSPYRESVCVCCVAQVYVNFHKLYFICFNLILKKTQKNSLQSQSTRATHAQKHTKSGTCVQRAGCIVYCTNVKYRLNPKPKTEMQATLRRAQYAVCGLTPPISLLQQNLDSLLLITYTLPTGYPTRLPFIMCSLPEYNYTLSSLFGM